jgi:hypothetical protein
MQLSPVPLHILDEDTIDLPTVALLLGPKGKAASLAKVCRAINPGVKAETGERVRLEAVRTGGCWLTSRQAVARFVQRISEASLSQNRLRPEKTKPSATVPISPRRERELDQVNCEVDALLSPPPRRRGRKPRAEKGGDS